MVWYCKLISFYRVLHNYVATILPNFKPTVFFKKPKQFIIFHTSKGNKNIT